MAVTIKCDQLPDGWNYDTCWECKHFSWRQSKNGSIWGCSLNKAAALSQINSEGVGIGLKDYYDSSGGRKNPYFDELCKESLIGKDDSNTGTLDEAAEEAGGFVANPFDKVRYDYRKILHYCDERGIEPVDMTIKEFNQFAIIEPGDRHSRQVAVDGMCNFLEYKGYRGTVEFSATDNILHGIVIDIRSLISYEGDSLVSVRKNFEDGVDGYLARCKESGIEPESPPRL